ncbi:MAG: hypothetical protein MI919_01820 [Holophagales bacterium]|nr:hypothetical protein [Holophagales bacterium]
MAEPDGAGGRSGWRTLFSRRLLAVGLAVGGASILLLQGLRLPRGGLHQWAVGAEPAPVLGRTSPLTRETGLEKAPALSPDGNWLAYASDQNGNLDIWIRQLESDAAAPLTADHAGYDDHPAFSPDGRWVAFVSDRHGGGVFLVPAAGGEPRRLLGYPLFASHDSKLRAPTLAFSPDGSYLAVAGTQASPGIVLVPLGERGGSGPVVPVELPEHASILSVAQPAFSPDGRLLAYAALSGSATTWSALWIVGVPRAPSDGAAPEAGSVFEPVPVTGGRKLDFHPVFSADGKRLFFLSDRGGTKDVWWVELGEDGRPEGLPRPLTLGIGIGSFALDEGRGRLVYSELEERSNIWRMPVLDRPARLADTQMLTPGNDLIEFAGVSPDGRYLAFDSDRSGNMDLWLLTLENGEMSRLTEDPAHDWCPRFSPDGRHLAFYSLRSGSRDIYVLDLPSGPDLPARSPSAAGAQGGGGAAAEHLLPRRLTHAPGRDWMPHWSADGGEIFFDSDRSGARGVWSIPAEGGVARPWPVEGVGSLMYPVASPDGNRLAATYRTDHDLGLLILPLDGEPPIHLTDDDWLDLFAFAWSEDGRSLFVSGRRTADRPAAYWRVDVDSGELSMLSNFQSADFRGASLEPMDNLAYHGGYLFFSLWELRGDLRLAELAPRG